MNKRVPSTICLLIGVFCSYSQSKISYEFSAGLGDLYWSKTIQETITTYSPFTGTQPPFLFLDASYKDHSFNYQGQAKIVYQFKKFSLGLSFTHSRFTKHQFKSKPAQYVYMKYYEPDYRHFNLYGISASRVKFHNRKLEVLPVVDVGLHWFESVKPDYYRNNYFLRAGIKATKLSTGKVKTFFKPELTFIHYKFAQLSTLPDGSVDDAWTRFTSAHVNNLLIINTTIGIQIY
jgi:hypothetical protein